MEEMTMHRQWASRPNDERYSTLREMYDYLAAETAQCGQAVVGTGDLHVEAGDKGGLALVGAKGNPAHLTHWSMSQLCGIARSPSNFMRELPAELAATVLNDRLAAQPRDSHQLYLRRRPANGSPEALQLRAITSPTYTRVHTAAVVKRLMQLQAEYPSWTAPLIYPQGNFGGPQTPCVGYAGDRDAYVCLQNESAQISDPADPSGDGLTRFVLLVNSEVGAKRLDLTLGLCERICGNFILWGARTLATFSMRHFGDRIRREWSRGISTTFYDYAQLSAADQQRQIQHAHMHQLGAKKEDVIDLLFKKDIASKQQLTDAYELAERFNRNPRTAWGMAHAITRLSQQSPYADERIDLDRAAAKVLEF
jgi:hypothetical protein